MSRWRARIVVLVASGLALGIVPFGTASASCAGPVLRPPDQPISTPTVLPLRARFTVAGVWFNSGCDDTGQGAGCGAPASEEAPLKDVGLVLEQGTRMVTLATADAGSRGKRFGISWSAQIPTGFVEGPAVLRAAGATLAVDLHP